MNKQLNGAMMMVLNIKLTMFILFFIFITEIVAKDVLSGSELLNLRNVSEVAISPDGSQIAYTLYVPRKANDKPGKGYSELHIIDVVSAKDKTLIGEKVNISKPQWSPSGELIAFRMKSQDNKHHEVWQINLAGEQKQLTQSAENVIDFHWHPSGKKIAYISTTSQTKKEKTLAEKGYDFIFFEEMWKHKNLYLINLADPQNIVQLTRNITVWDFVFSDDGNHIAFSASPKNLIDHKFMFRKIHLLNLNTSKSKIVSKNEGKLGNYQISPDNKNLVYAASFDRKDNNVSQAFVVTIDGEKVINLTPDNFAGHINWVGWKDNTTIFYKAGEGVNVTLNSVKINGTQRTAFLNSADNGIIFDIPSMNKSLTRFAFKGQSPYFPDDLFYWDKESKIKRLTISNPILNEKELGKQEIIQYKARDGYEIEGLLIYPVNYKKGQRYPLIMQIHGGPESHYTNRWFSRYANPAQVMAGKGYVVFFPNYRSSTGYGLKHAAFGYNDPAGVEFDDIADGIDHLVNIGLVDEKRVGLGGKSYGGYAAAWFATYYTKKVRAVCAYVGISDLISKRSTTDIPYEELYVHSGKKLEEMWQKSLEYSPIYYAHQSKTATFICGGADDPRVHPGQSIELYRRMKMNNHPAVRLVQYPKEGHSNDRQTSRADLLYRQLDWFDWYVRDLKPLDGPMPALDISEKYGLDFEIKEGKKN